MPKTIKLELSQQGIKKAIQEVLEYQKSLESKVRVFAERLSEIGLSVTNAVMSSVPAEDEPGTWNVETNITSSGENSTATITLSGDKVLFIEFGAGSRYASTQNPLAAELGYGPGTYPGQTHVPNPGFWYYKDEASGESKKSHGNRAYMPMYHASEAIALQLKQVAKEVFG